jgi:DNA-directed RNA polymerase subunit E'/Rpb7
MVFLISRSIYLAGLKPSYFFSDPFEFYTERLERELEDALDKDVQLAISQTDETNELIITIN